MSGLIIWQLLGSFTNVFLLTRVTQYFLKFTKLSGKKRAYITFILISSIDFVGLVIFTGSIRDGISALLFFYMPFLVMWLLKDLFEASRKEKEMDEQAQETEPIE